MGSSIALASSASDVAGSGKMCVLSSPEEFEKGLDMGNGSEPFVFVCNGPYGTKSQYSGQQPSIMLTCWSQRYKSPECRSWNISDV